MKGIIKKLYLYLIVNRLVILVATYIIANTNGIGNSFTNFIDFLTKFGARWDGNSYSFISRFGYVNTGIEKNYIVFPPLYPMIIRPFGYLIGNYPLAGMLISNILFIFACIIFYKLLKIDYTEKFSLYTIFLISLFPTTFFFSVAYPESLFVFLFALSFYLARKRKYLLSGLAGGLAVIARPFGIIIFPALVVYLYIQKDLDFKKAVSLSFVFGLPILIYLLINYLLFGNPFAFLTLLKENWQKSFAFPWQGILASWRRGIFTHEFSTYKFFVGYGEAIASTLAWISIPIGIKKWGLKSPYSVYLFLATALFTSTGYILSAPRYLLSIPPFFILFAEILDSNKILKVLWIIVSITLLFYISREFAWGHWAF